MDEKRAIDRAGGPEFIGIQLHNEDAWLLARLAIVGFVTLNNLHVLLDYPAGREALVASFGMMREGVPFDRACRVLQALNTSQPEHEAELQAYMQHVMAQGRWRGPSNG